MISLPERTVPPGPLKRAIRTGFIIVAIIVFLVLLLPYALAPLYRVINPVSTLMLWRWGRGAPVESTWMPLDRMANAPPAACRPIGKQGGHHRHQPQPFSSSSLSDSALILRRAPAGPRLHGTILPNLPYVVVRFGLLGGMLV
jgi:hypothetical protein